MKIPLKYLWDPSKIKKGMIKILGIVQMYINILQEFNNSLIDARLLDKGQRQQQKNSCFSFKRQKRAILSDWCLSKEMKGFFTWLPLWTAGISQRIRSPANSFDICPENPEHPRNVDWEFFARQVKCWSSDAITILIVKEHVCGLSGVSRTTFWKSPNITKLIKKMT